MRKMSGGKAKTNKQWQQCCTLTGKKVVKNALRKEKDMRVNLNGCRFKRVISQFIYKEQGRN